MKYTYKYVYVRIQSYTLLRAPAKYSQKNPSVRSTNFVRLAMRRSVAGSLSECNYNHALINTKDADTTSHMSVCVLTVRE